MVWCIVVCTGGVPACERSLTPCGCCLLLGNAIVVVADMLLMSTCEPLLCGCAGAPDGRVLSSHLGREATRAAAQGGLPQPGELPLVHCFIACAATAQFTACAATAPPACSAAPCCTGSRQVDFFKCTSVGSLTGAKINVQFECFMCAEVLEMSSRLLLQPNGSKQGFAFRWA
jgi:hypothetical protein